MFIDELTVDIHAGKGGDGIVSWMHVKGIDHAGPGGGDGGRGDVICSWRFLRKEYEF
jgi:GTP-binding protein